MPKDAKVLLVIRVNYTRQGFSQRIVFFFFILENFILDETVKNDVTRRTVMYVEGARGLPMPQLGVRGSSLGNFFADISSEKGILGQI